MLLKKIWETGKFPQDLLVGVATACFKSGNADLWSRYRIIVVFCVEFKIFSTMLYMRIMTEVQEYLSRWHFAFLRGRGTADVHYIANQLYRKVCESGKRAMKVHVDYVSAFDSLSHVYLFKSLEKAGASAKTLQLFKATYRNAQVVARIGALLSKPCAVERGVLEGDINSPIYFSIGLETVFREVDDLSLIHI